MTEPPVRPVRSYRFAFAYLLAALVVVASTVSAYFLATIAPESMLRSSWSSKTLGLAISFFVLAPLVLLWMKIISHLLTPDERDKLLSTFRRGTKR